MACNTTCIKCGDKFDRFSGKLINLSDQGLQKFYSIPYIKEYCKNPEHKHVTLCAKCLEEELKGPLKMSDLKIKNGRYMTSNIAFMLKSGGWLSAEALEYLKANDKAGVLNVRVKDVNIIKLLSSIVMNAACKQNQ